MPDDFSDLAPLAVVVMGVCGCGKSTLGDDLARALAAPFIEGDTLHSVEAVEKMRGGTPLNDDDRWPWIERIGHTINVDVAERGIAVAACSGLRRSYRDLLRKSITARTRFVLLDAAEDVLQRRLMERSGHYMPASLLASQLATLERPQSDEDVLTLDAQQQPAILRDETLAWLRRSAC